MKAAKLAAEQLAKEKTRAENVAKEKVAKLAMEQLAKEKAVREKVARAEAENMAREKVLECEPDEPDEAPDEPPMEREPDGQPIKKEPDKPGKPLVEKELRQKKRQRSLKNTTQTPVVLKRRLPN